LVFGQLTFDRFDETQTPCTWSNSREYGGCGCAPVAVPCVVGQDGVADFFAKQALVHPLGYNYQRFEDTLRTYNNGEAHLFLAGLSGRY